jgi:hypothetical protein
VHPAQWSLRSCDNEYPAARSGGMRELPGGVAPAALWVLSVDVGRPLAKCGNAANAGVTW